MFATNYRICHNQSMLHECQKDLDAALTEIEQSTRLLRAFIFCDSLELIEKHGAQIRVAHIHPGAAMAAYRDHRMETK